MNDRTNYTRERISASSAVNFLIHTRLSTIIARAYRRMIIITVVVIVVVVDVDHRLVARGIRKYITGHWLHPSVTLDYFLV